MKKQIGWLCLVSIFVLVWIGASGCGQKKIDNEEKIRLYYEAGIGYINRGEPQQAVGTLKQAYRLDEKYPQVLHALGLAYLQMGVPETALIWFEKARKITPDDPRLNNNMASVYIALKQYDTAIEFSTRALDNLDYRTPAAAYFNRGVGKMNTNDLEGAEKDFKAAIQHEPLYEAPRLELARIRYQKGRYDQAIQLADSIIEKMKKKNPEAYLLRGKAYWQRGYVTKAENDFTYVTRMDDASPALVEEAHNWLDRIR